MRTAVTEKKEVSNIGFMVAMVSWGMLFGSLFLAYALYRFRTTAWPPMGFEEVSLFWPTISTIVICLSSLTYFLFEKNFLSNNLKIGRLLYLLTIGLGAAFLLCQRALWQNLKSTGLDVNSGIFASILHGFTWIHAAHILLGILALIYLIRVVKSDSFGHVEHEILVNNIGKFWHFLGVIWILMFLTLFLL